MLRSNICALALLAFVAAPVAHADDSSVNFSPSPAFAGAYEQFSACGFQDGEVVDLSIDGTAATTAPPAAGGCASIPLYQLPLDIAPSPHQVSLKGEQSGTERTSPMIVAPPLVVPTVATVPGGVAVVTGQFFAPGRAPMLLPTGGLITPTPAQTDANGNLTASVMVPDAVAPGAYPVLIQDDPWLTSPPPLTIIVNPKQAAGNWLLKAVSTLTRDSGALTANGTSTFEAPFSDAGGQLKGQGQLSISLDMKANDATCHGQTQVPFGVGGTESGCAFHFTFTGLNASVPITVTCSNGFSLPFPLPGGSSSEPFDIQATDGQSADFDGSNPFVIVPANFNGHSHVTLSKQG